LPGEAAVRFVEAEEDAPVAFVPGIPRMIVVGADKDLAAGDYRGGIGAGA